MSLDILKQTKEALDKAISEKKISQEMLKNLSPAIIQTLTPVLQEIADNARITKEDLLNVLSKIKVQVPDIKIPEAKVRVEIPEIKVPEANVKVNVDKIEIPDIKTDGIEKTLRDVLTKFKLPKPEVTVNVPKFDKMEWPEGNMPVEGLVTLKGIDRKNPLPVELRNADGSPMKWPEYIGASSGGGVAHNVKIGGFSQSAYSDYINADGRLRVSVETGGSGLTDSELRAAHIDVQQLSGSTDSVFITGSADSMMAFQARQTNPTVVVDGADVRPKADDLGRLLNRPIQVRDLIQTAYVTLNTGTETTLLAGVASTFHDLIYMMMANSSDAAVIVDVRAGTANGVVASVAVPANGTAGVSLPVPIPQDLVGNAWTVDMPDITGNSVYVSDLFSKQV